MAHINRFHSVRRIAGAHNSIAWEKNASALLFAALLVVCSIAVGCSKDRPQPVSSNQIPTTQSSNPAVSTDLLPAASSVPEPAKKASKRVARKRPSTVTYSDKTYGVSFQYPRKYALETGDAANELIASGLVPMDFTRPGGTVLAAVSLPSTSFPGTDFESGLFNVSVNKNVSAEDCGKFSVPQPDPKTPADSGTQASAASSKLMLGELELQSAEAVAAEGSKESDAKYFHLFQNGACFEFALRVGTIGGGTETATKHVDHDKVFSRLEKIRATLKITPAAAAEVVASAPHEAPKETAAPRTPAQ
jgi:hypothetical protein